MEFYRFTWHETASIDFDGEYVTPVFPNPKIILNKYRLIRETDKGYWIGLDGFSESFWKKWVSKSSKKRFAYPTKKEALINFRKRNEHRAKILQRQLDCCIIVTSYSENYYESLIN